MSILNLNLVASCYNAIWGNGGVSERTHNFSVYRHARALLHVRLKNEQATEAL